MTTLSTPIAPRASLQAEALRRPTTPGQLVWRRFRRHTMANAGGVALILVLLLIVGSPITARYSPTDQDLRHRFQPPSLEHWMGTDQLGRDLWSRVLYGGQFSLAVGFLSMAVSISVGSLIGLAAGYYGGWVDQALMRLTDLFLTIPRLFVLIVLTTLLRQARIPGVEPGSFVPIAGVIGLMGWTGIARLVRGSTLELRQRDFIAAARCVGASDRRLMFRHILPNVVSPIIVSATLGLSGAIISESGLSYLGFGVQLPTPTWGNMLSTAQSDMMTAPWVAIFPGLMIFVVVIAVNYLGDGLRDALDPRHVIGGKT